MLAQLEQFVHRLEIAIGIRFDHRFGHWRRRKIVDEIDGAVVVGNVGTGRRDQPVNGPARAVPIRNESFVGGLENQR